MGHTSDEDPSLKKTIQLPFDPSDNDEELLKTSDFQSLELKVKISNMTGQTPLRDQDQIKVIQFLEKGMILQVPKKSCSGGHHLAIEIEMTGNPTKAVEFKATAKVEKVENSGSDKMDEITIKFLQFGEVAWNQIRNGLEDRQKEINQFFQAARGR